MIIKEFKGHKLSNSNWAIAFGYPEVSNGGDLINDVSKMANQVNTSTILKLYVAYRRAGDKAARNIDTEDIMNEVCLTDPKEIAELVEVITELISEQPKTKKE